MKTSILDVNQGCLFTFEDMRHRRVGRFRCRIPLYISSRETGKPRSENTIHRMEIFVSDP
ncbi:hypothetical protein IR083_21895 [Dysgonomonas sp. GY75]|uniref:hypothetical protein n=1 Tax=Dysgonomonas sp. GY75 TaxID=2780419 RepID=UPI00145F3F3B|nr:hypothetical protein [Dysgonomonas sp. GY75]MBF0651473.1 hypothetical protein [Dysgonomonas sp. GY75]